MSSQPCKLNANVTDCKCTQQIIKTLIFHQELPNDLDSYNLNNRIVAHFNQYPTIVSDYHHIILQHLSSGNKYEDNINLNIITDILSNHINCNFSKCIKYKRNLRGRYKKTKQDEYSEEKLMTETFKLSMQDPVIMFYKELLDTMHCYFIHAFDTGRRKQSTQQLPAYLEDDYDDNTFEDKQMKELFLDTKSLDSATPLQFNKFTTQITDENFQNQTDDDPLLDKMIEHMQQEKIPKIAIENFYNQLLQQEYDSDALTDDIGNDETNINVVEWLPNTEHCLIVVDYIKNIIFSKSTVLYSFGLRYYYWEPCKTHPLYVPTKYTNFKQEMFAKKEIPKDEWDRIYLKVNTMMVESDTVKALKSCDRNYAYGIKENSPIKHQHLIAICFYTDTSEESYKFSESFRRIPSDKSIEDTKKRNMEYREWSRLLREAVECYGTTMEESKINIFYHGVSMIHFVSFIAKFCGPTSTSASFEIATRFADEKGIILELETAQMGDKLRYFNCSYISRYNEEERLFIGGEYPLKIKTIRNKSTKENYEQIMLPLSLLDKMTNAEKMETQFISQKTLKHCVVVIHDLIQQETEEKKNQYPEYINTCFKAFVKSRKVLKFNMLYMKQFYSFFVYMFMDQEYARYFVNDTDNNLLAIDYISNVFKECTEIYSMKTDQVKEAFDGQNWLYMDALRSLLNRVNSNKLCKLNRIIICGKNDLNNSEMYEKYKKWISNKTGWNLQIMKRDGQLVVSRK
eukprot:163346_1